MQFIFSDYICIQILYSHEYFDEKIRNDCFTRHASLCLQFSSCGFSTHGIKKLAGL